MKRWFAFVLLALAVLMYVPSISAQTTQQDSLTPTPYAIIYPPGDNWLLSSWYCIPSDCFDYTVVYAGYGTASTAAYGTCFGASNQRTPAHNPAPIATVIAENCQALVFLETGTATFRLTTLHYITKTYGLEGLIVPAEASGDNGTGIGYDLQWCNGTETIADFVLPC
jgi:hypothetical protein